MLGPVLPVLTFVALAQARAIVTNHCSYNVYVWSVPQVLSSSHTDNVPIKPGGQYQEPWRHGSIVNPGVAIKISTKSDGILKFADEIDFAYAVDGNDDSKIWVDLSPVRGDAFKDNLAFHSCLTQYGSSNVQTHQCTATDDVELVLCDTSPRSTPEKDPKTLEQVKACYDYHHVLPEDHDGLQVAADDDTESDEDTDCCESRDGPSVEFTYSMAITVESMLAPSSVSSTKVHSPTNVTSTTSSTSSVRLFTPPAAREIDCPGCEKLLILSPCLARVVYPARRRAPATPRHTPDAITPQRGANPPLCEIIQMYHSGFEDCDEAAIESYARSLYPKICEPEFSSLLMGFPCEEVMEELKKVYPDIDAPKVSRTTCKCDADCDFCGHFNDTCICAGANAMAVRDDIQPLPTNVEAPIITPKEPRIGLFSVCGPTLYVADSTMVVDLLDAITLFNERYENWVNEVLGSCNAVSVLPNQDGKHGVCLADLCGLHPTSCDGIRALVTSATKAKFDKDGVYLANRDVCAKWEDSFLGED